MAAVDQEQVDAVNSLKAAHELISSSLQNDLVDLQKKHRDLTSDFNEQKTQLVEALLSKDRLMQDLSAAKDGSGSTADGQAHARATIEAEEKLREVSQQTTVLCRKPPVMPRFLFSSSNRTTFSNCSFITDYIRKKRKKTDNITATPQAGLSHPRSSTKAQNHRGEHSRSAEGTVP